MKKLFSITFLLISNCCFSQIKSVIIDSETKEKIPYVNIWVENENIGTTSNEKGEFELEIDRAKVILFSAIGFETKKISSDSMKSILELKPFITELKEVVIKSKKLNKKLVIGKFKKAKINHYFACGTQPWITGRYFKFNQDYNNTPFLNKIRLLTNSEVKDSKFIIRLYSVSENEEPENYIYDENIIGIAKKGKNITEIDISDLNFEFPKEGFFIAIEWLIIENNKHEFSYTVQESKKKLIGISYAPAIGTVPAETEEHSWIFNQGKWIKIFKNNILAIELTLTN